MKRKVYEGEPCEMTNAHGLLSAALYLLSWSSETLRHQTQRACKGRVIQGGESSDGLGKQHTSLKHVDKSVTEVLGSRFES